MRLARLAYCCFAACSSNSKAALARVAGDSCVNSCPHLLQMLRLPRLSSKLRAISAAGRSAPSSFLQRPLNQRWRNVKQILDLLVDAMSPTCCRYSPERVPAGTRAEERRWEEEARPREQKHLDAKMGGYPNGRSLKS